jgi:hypothetical protein
MREVVTFLRACDRVPEGQGEPLADSGTAVRASSTRP